MKIPVLKPFRDIQTKEMYKAGDVLEMTRARYKKAVKNLEKYGGGFLGEPLTEDGGGQNGTAGQSAE